MIHKNLDGSYDLVNEDTGGALHMAADTPLAEIEATARQFLARPNLAGRAWRGLRRRFRERRP